MVMGAGGVSLKSTGQARKGGGKLTEPVFLLTGGIYFFRDASVQLLKPFN